METKPKIPLIILLPAIVVAVLIILVIIMFILSGNEKKTEDAATEEESVSVEVTEADAEGTMTAEEYNELDVKDRNPISKEEFESLPDDEVYIDPKMGEKEIIPGIVPTKEQALNYLFEDAIYCYNVIGIFSGIPTVLSDPWETKSGGWSCFVNNEVGTTVLWAVVEEDGNINMGLYGSEFNKDFVGIMYNTSDGKNPDTEVIKKLEAKIMEEYGNSRKLKIKSFTDKSVTLLDKDGKETIINRD